MHLIKVGFIDEGVLQFYPSLFIGSSARAEKQKALSALHGLFS